MVREGGAGSVASTVELASGTPASFEARERLDPEPLDRLTVRHTVLSVVSQYDGTRRPPSGKLDRLEFHFTV